MTSPPKWPCASIHVSTVTASSSKSRARRACVTSTTITPLSASSLRQRLKPGDRLGELRVAEVPNGARHEERKEAAGIADPAHVADDRESVDQPEGSQSDRCVFPGTAGSEAFELRLELVEESKTAVRTARFVDERVED